MPPRTRPTEGSQRPGPRHQRTTSSESDPLRHRPNTEKSPRLLTGRSPRGSQSDPLGQKKLGNRISDLETQLVQAQRELKNLKQQLSSAEATKKDVHDELHKKTRKNASSTIQVERLGKRSASKENQGINKNKAAEQYSQEENADETHKETDVFEVPMQELSVESKPELEDHHGNAESKLLSPDDLEKPAMDERDLKNNEIEQLKAKLEAKEKEQESTFQENEILKKQLNEATAEISAARNKEEEMAMKCNQLERDLEANKATKYELKEKLEAVEAAKEELEAEMKKLRVQTEQWRKAADAAAAVLAGGVEVGGVRIAERCGVMDRHFNGMFELPPPPTAIPGFLASPGEADDLDDEFGGKRKGSGGIRMLGDLWKKKKGQK